MEPNALTHELTQFIQTHQPLIVITGAGCSVASGIPTYRDHAGTWQRSNPIQHQDFITDVNARRRYWARSFAGWPVVSTAMPNATHQSLQALEEMGLCRLLVTQNVDRLHQKAGHRSVIDLHGRLDEVHCLGCLKITPRSELQTALAAQNVKITDAEIAPDGDADVADELVDQFQVPACEDCGGMLKPSVVFYGGSVEKSVVSHIYSEIDEAAGLLVVGSSLMVFSSFRFCRHGANRNLPIAILNEGVTRGDDLASLKISAPSQTILPEAIQLLSESAQ